ncbi:sugar-binding domain-containing protein [Aquimarina agarivorans]|uniref:sugar-binding domain-containing protein n=1 Tax=Aquimarina agarivorans TaxID=980584 RepID=UPI000248F59E|nr:sugar-binding domain-containing protein [Aquimarina agarivorans]
MKLFFLISSLAFFLLSCNNQQSNDTLPPRNTDFNFDWKFHLDKGATDASSENFDDSSWKNVQLPHDWVIEESIDTTNASNQLYMGSGYRKGAGIGWYRKSFTSPAKDKKVYILFDGVYNNSEVFLNGQSLGKHPYGYSPFYFDITNKLKTDGSQNTIAVKVDHRTYADSRWYSGAGIYRNVSLITTNKLHIPVWGTFVTTPNANASNTNVFVKVKLTNDTNDTQNFILKTDIIDQKGIIITSSESEHKLESGTSIDVTENLKLNNPKLWGIYKPNLYKAVNTITLQNKVIDRKETKFGIRNIHFDADTGFFLNGENKKIKGVCLHHDGGLVGAAVPKGVWKRRLLKLKEGGVNAIRISHNPASNEFLDLCDEMGFLVQDEFFDEWDYPKDKRFNQKEQKALTETEGYTRFFQEWAEKDLKNTVLSHRNHPSIFQWSIGNEIEWTYPRNAAATGFFNNMNWDGNYFWSEPPYSTEEIKKQLKTLPKGKYDIATTAKKLSKWTKQLDITRPITANCILPSASHLSGYADALDVVGYSYRRVLYDYGHKNYPEKPIMGTENLAQWHEWEAILERPHISGTFLWTGIDYQGEIREPWPTTVQPSGLLDIAGFEGGSFGMMKSLWNPNPNMFVTTQVIEKSLYQLDANGKIIPKDPDAWKHALWQWHDINRHWNYEKGKIIAVESYSNCPEMELFLNGKSFGKKFLKDNPDHIYKWAVPYSAGKLKLVGLKNGKNITKKIVTAGAAAKVKLTVDHTKIKNNRYDVAHVTAQLIDKNGTPVLTENKKIVFNVPDSLRLLGVDNGDKQNHQDYNSNTIETSKGRALLIVQSTEKITEATINATSGTLTSNDIIIKVN